MHHTKFKRHLIFLVIFIVLGLPNSAAVNGSAPPVPIDWLAVEPECQGDGCSQVVITWDDTKQQYKAQNNSAHQWVKVEAGNLAASASVCLPPTKHDYLALTSVVGTFRATLSQQNCGTQP